MTSCRFSRFSAPSSFHWCFGPECEDFWRVLGAMTLYQNPREAGSRSRIFLISLVYVFVGELIYLCVSRLLAKRKTIYTWNLVHILHWTLSKNRFFFGFFSEKMTLRAANLEKLLCHGDFSHIFSISLVQFSFAHSQKNCRRNQVT